MTLLIGLLLAAVSVTSTPPASTSTPLPTTDRDKTAVFVQIDAQDRMGAEYVARFRQALAASHDYQPVATPGTAKFVVGILTMDPSEGDAGAAVGRSTVASITLRRENESGPSEFIYSWVLVARRDNVDALAAELVAAVDREIQGANAPIVFLDDAPATNR